MLKFPAFCFRIVISVLFVVKVVVKAKAKRRNVKWQDGEKTSSKEKTVGGKPV